MENDKLNQNELNKHKQLLVPEESAVRNLYRSLYGYSVLYDNLGRPTEEHLRKLSPDPYEEIDTIEGLLQMINTRHERTIMDDVLDYEMNTSGPPKIVVARELMKALIVSFFHIPEAEFSLALLELINAPEFETRYKEVEAEINLLIQEIRYYELRRTLEPDLSNAEFVEFFKQLDVEESEYECFYLPPWVLKFEDLLD